MTALPPITYGFSTFGFGAACDPRVLSALVPVVRRVKAGVERRVGRVGKRVRGVTAALKNLRSLAIAPPAGADGAGASTLGPGGSEAKAGGKRRKGTSMGIPDCCICLFPVSIRQALFIAPCSHTFHYKCLRPLLEAHHPAFSCPLCRTFADLEEDVEVELEEVRVVSFLFLRFVRGLGRWAERSVESKGVVAVRPEDVTTGVGRIGCLLADDSVAAGAPGAANGEREDTSVVMGVSPRVGGRPYGTGYESRRLAAGTVRTCVLAKAWEFRRAYSSCRTADVHPLALFAFFALVLCLVPPPTFFLLTFLSSQDDEFENPDGFAAETPLVPHPTSGIALPDEVMEEGVLADDLEAEDGDEVDELYAIPGGHARFAGAETEVEDNGVHSSGPMDEDMQPPLVDDADADEMEVESSGEGVLGGATLQGKRKR
ncbi:hypothetical protein C8R45DRAFT_1193432 [Mycena sanguinolenta]|nr:hypothetical protein C8R45DRAFT_1193432 [Mycena sanguinolenta]